MVASLLASLVLSMPVSLYWSDPVKGGCSMTFSGSGFTCTDDASVYPSREIILSALETEARQVGRFYEDWDLVLGQEPGYYSNSSNTWGFWLTPYDVHCWVHEWTMLSSAIELGGSGDLYVYVDGGDFVTSVGCGHPILGSSMVPADRCDGSWVLSHGEVPLGAKSAGRSKSGACTLSVEPPVLATWAPDAGTYNSSNVYPVWPTTIDFEGTLPVLGGGSCAGVVSFEVYTMPAGNPVEVAQASGCTWPGECDVVGLAEGAATLDGKLYFQAVNSMVENVTFKKASSVASTVQLDSTLCNAYLNSVKSRVWHSFYYWAQTKPFVANGIQSVIRIPWDCVLGKLVLSVRFQTRPFIAAWQEKLEQDTSVNFGRFFSLLAAQPEQPAFLWEFTKNTVSVSGVPMMITIDGTPGVANPTASGEGAALVKADGSTAAGVVADNVLGAELKASMLNTHKTGGTLDVIKASILRQEEAEYDNSEAILNALTGEGSVLDAIAMGNEAAYAQRASNHGSLLGALGGVESGILGGILDSGGRVEGAVRGVGQSVDGLGSGLDGIEGAVRDGTAQTANQLDQIIGGLNGAGAGAGGSGGGFDTVPEHQGVDAAEMDRFKAQTLDQWDEFVQTMLDQGELGEAVGQLYERSTLQGIVSDLTATGGFDDIAISLPMPEFHSPWGSKGGRNKYDPQIEQWVTFGMKPFTVHLPPSVETLFSACRIIVGCWFAVIMVIKSVGYLQWTIVGMNAGKGQ